MVAMRPVRSEADGARLVDEHLPLELAVALWISAYAAIGLVRDVAYVRPAAVPTFVWGAWGLSWRGCSGGSGRGVARLVRRS